MRAISSVLIFLAGCLLQDARGSALGNDTDNAARFLAGIVTPHSSSRPSEPPGWWSAHAREIGRRWNQFDAEKLAAARAFSRERVRSHHELAYYMFGGPDFPFLNAFFPQATTYVLSGLEAVEDPAHLSQRLWTATGLQQFRKSLDTYFELGFFRTDQMIAQQGFVGVTPLLLGLIARSGNRITDASALDLGDDGKAVDHRSSSEPPGGLRIAFTDAEGRAKTLYYFRADLSDGGKGSAALWQFCGALGYGDNLLKSASYLLHEDGFSTARAFLLGHSRLLVQDDSGIPVRFLDRTNWELGLFGKYQAPIGRFEKYYQPDLAALPQPGSFGAYTFRTGYLAQVGASNYLLAKRRGDP
jgi:hypothetical protein